MRVAVAIVLLLTLPGCAFDQKNRQAEAISQTTPEPKLADIVQIPPVTSADIEEISTNLKSSNNANQQNFSGLGAQVAKVAENVDLNVSAVRELKANMHFLGVLHTELKAEVAAYAQAEIKAEIKAQSEIYARMHAELRAEIRATAQAQLQATAQAGIGNKSETTQQTTAAGGDINNQYTSDMKETLFKSYSTILWVVAVTGGLGALTALLAEASRRREVRRTAAQLKEVRSGKTRVE